MVEKMFDGQLSGAELEKKYPCPDSLKKDFKTSILYTPVCIQTFQRRLLKHDGENPVYLYHADHHQRECQWVILPCANGNAMFQSLTDGKVLHVTYKGEQETWFMDEISESKENQFQLDRSDKVYKGKPYTVFAMKSETTGTWF